MIGYLVLGIWFSVALFKNLPKYKKAKPEAELS